MWLEDAGNEQGCNPGGWSALKHPIKERKTDSTYGYYDNLSASIDEATGEATIDQDHTSLVECKDVHFKTGRGFNFLFIKLINTGDFFEIDLGPSEEEILRKE